MVGTERRFRRGSASFWRFSPSFIQPGGVSVRVLHVIAGARTGGAETFSQDMIAALAERGIEQKVITRRHSLALNTFKAANVEVSFLDFSMIDRLTGGSRFIEQEARSFKADIVHAWMSRAASFVPETSSVVTIGWLGGYYDIKNFKHCDHLIGVTPDIVRHLLTAGALPHRCGVVNTFGTLRESPPVSKTDLDTPEDAPVILVLSRMHKKKGIDTILHALTKIPGAYLWLAGDGPEETTYRRLCAKLNLSERVRFLGWRDDRKALLDSCDVVALPSRYEPFGTVIAEAWSMRRPLVATAAAGARQYVTDGVNGLLTPIDDSESLANNLRRVILDRGLRDTLIEKGFATYATLFTKECVSDRMLEFYRRSIDLGKKHADSFLEISDISNTTVSKVVETLRDRVRNIDIQDLKRAATVVLAYMTAYGGDCREIASEAAALEMSGIAHIIRGPRVLILGARDLDRIFSSPAIAGSLSDYASCISAIFEIIS